VGDNGSSILFNNQWGDRPIMQEHRVDLLVILDRGETAPEGLTRQLYAQVREAVVTGRLRAGERLPPTRDLARRLGVARLTVATAYDWLRAEGYVYGKVGAGTFVASVFGDGVATPRGDASGGPSLADSPSSSPAARPSLTDTLAASRLSAWARRIAAIPLGGSGNVEPARFDFRPSIGAADAFPWARWRRAVGWPDPADQQSERRASQREEAARAGRWDALLGPLETRQAIAGWLRRSRAVRCEAEQLLIAGSVQQMLAILARLLIEPGQRLIVEDPSYIGFHAAFLAEGAQLLAIPADAGGIVTDRLPRSSEDDGGDARLAVVTPSHQFPLGVTLTLERRVALLEWARRAGAVIVEDDYDGDLRLEGQPLEALRGLDERDEVIYLGTFAKALYPATRLAYAVLPGWLVEPVARARAASDRHPTWSDALAVTRFIDSGELERHLGRVRRLYRARRDALVAALREELGEAVTIGPAEAGIHLVIGFAGAVDDVALAEAAGREGIAVTALSPHYARAARSGLLLGFGGQPEDALRAGVARLAPLIRSALGAGR
jgi:GntR family transcriptional regulator/MocR family aminotransferase